MNLSATLKADYFFFLVLLSPRTRPGIFSRSYKLNKPHALLLSFERCVKCIPCYSSTGDVEQHRLQTGLCLYPSQSKKRALTSRESNYPHKRNCSPEDTTTHERETDMRLLVIFSRGHGGLDYLDAGGIIHGRSPEPSTAPRDPTSTSCAELSSATAIRSLVPEGRRGEFAVHRHIRPPVG